MASRLRNLTSPEFFAILIIIQEIIIKITTSKANSKIPDDGRSLVLPLAIQNSVTSGDFEKSSADWSVNFVKENTR